jgi:serine/threonine protein kinase
VSLVKLADFGLAKTLTDDLQYNVGGEKIPYRWCAPEVLQTFQHSSASDVRCDWNDTFVD